MKLNSYFLRHPSRA